MSQHSTKPRWRHPILLAPRALRPWLTATGSLTARLIAHYPQFSVRVVAQQLARPHRDELKQLGSNSAHARVETREVLLLSGNTPLVFAHSIATPAALRRGFRAVGKLGNQSLGSFLFATPTIQRAPLSWCKIDRRHPLWQKAARQVVGQLPKQLWARRSLFYAGRDALMVTEVFLPPYFTTLPSTSQRSSMKQST
ncbi:chorismate--pyruvate lyase family protein [Andreprevotia chitinilytica]|uniref:chorismate--pyruvate lyase family protein n=1 Tax=Andreprevotia chitinilytica TaxID=396808 RepID=UPI00068DEDC3|nr:chorismate lyase [Andreprevotia chitinilytica]